VPVRVVRRGKLSSLGTYVVGGFILLDVRFPSGALELSVSWSHVTVLSDSIVSHHFLFDVD